MYKILTEIINITEDENKRIFSPKLLYNENYLLSLVMYWFLNNDNFIVNSDTDRRICKAFKCLENTRCYIDATLETPFKVRHKGEKDPLAEPSTNVSGVVGHFKVLYGKKKERIVLLKDANQFIVIETTMSTPLKKGIKVNKEYQQVARDICCMVQTLSHLENKFIDHIGLFVIAPQVTLKLESFKTYTYKKNIEEVVENRVKQYGNDSSKKAFLELFTRLFSRIDVDCISYEEIVMFIKKNDSEYGDKLEEFYELCLVNNGIK